MRLTDLRTDNKLYVRLGNDLYREATSQEINESTAAMDGLMRFLAEKSRQKRRTLTPEDYNGEPWEGPNP